MTANAIDISQVTKKYGPKVILSDLNLEIPNAGVFALIGPNGAGKTTLIKSILNLTAIQKGSIKIREESWCQVNTHRLLAYLPEYFTFYPYFSVQAVLAFYHQMYGITEPKKTVIENALKKLSIWDLKDRKMKNLSKGQRQRVGLACLYMSNRSILILDEPFSGLDPVGFKDLKDIINEWKIQGKVVFINSHILGEIEKIADVVAILHQGKILHVGPIKDIPSNTTLENIFCELIKG